MNKLLVLFLVVGALVLFSLRLQIKRPSEEYYGTSTHGPCEVDEDCRVSGCNSEICQSKAEEPMYSICIVPDKPTPTQLGYECKCVLKECQWSKS